MAIVTETWESHLQTLNDEAAYFSRRSNPSQHQSKSQLSEHCVQPVILKKRPSLPPLRNTSQLSVASGASERQQYCPQKGTPLAPEAPPKRRENAVRRPTPPYSSRPQTPSITNATKVTTTTSEQSPSISDHTLASAVDAAGKNTQERKHVRPEIANDKSPEKALVRKASEETLAKLVLQGTPATSSSLGFDTSWRRRPGVNDRCLLISVRLIQQKWRCCRAQRQLTAARLKLGHDAIVGSRLVSTSAADSLSTGAVGEVQNNSNSRRLLPDLLWCEAAAYRQPCIHDILRAQRRWILQCENIDQGVQLANLDIAATSTTLKAMVQYEKRFQLRAAACGAWRPPCALGVSACQTLEAQALVWTDSIHASPQLQPLYVCLCLFKLIVAGSCLSRGRCRDAGKVLQFVDEALDTAPDDTYVQAVAPQIRARVLYLQSRISLLRDDLEGALTLSQRALVLLNDRHGPRDFWPPHCWELAACHRIKFLSLAYGSQSQKASAALRDLEQVVAPAPMREAEPELTVSLEEDASAMRVECEVLERADGVAMQPSGATAETLHSLLKLAESVLKKMVGAHPRARLLAVLGKLHLLQELQWHAAGAGRPETMDTADEYMHSAFAALGVKGVVQKVLPVKIVCLVLRDERDTGIALADAWLAKCAGVFGEGDGLSMRARLAAEDLRKVVSTTGVPKKHITRALRSILCCTDVGIREVAIT